MKVPLALLGRLQTDLAAGELARVAATVAKQCRFLL